MQAKITLDRLVVDAICVFQIGVAGLKLVIAHRRKSLIVTWFANDMGSASIRISGGGETGQEQNLMLGDVYI